MAVPDCTVGEQNKRRDLINKVALAALCNAIFNVDLHQSDVDAARWPVGSGPVGLTLTAVAPGLLVRTATGDTYSILSIPSAVVAHMRER